MNVRAKFTCQSVTNHAGGSATIKMQACCSSSGENKSFTDHTPQGTFEMMVAPGKPAGKAFEPGKSYYLDFTAAPAA